VYCFLSAGTSDTLLYNCRFPTLLEGYAQLRSLSNHAYFNTPGVRGRAMAMVTRMATVLIYSESAFWSKEIRRCLCGCSLLSLADLIIRVVLMN
jgi:hypothetical protein